MSLLGTSETIFNNIIDFLSSLTIIDIVFFFSVLLLLILIVVLLYFIKLNEDDKEIEIETISEDNDIENIETINETEDNNEVKYAEEKVLYNDEEGELLDLKSITKALENNEYSNVDLTAFEEEQEKEAIISYEELLNRSKNGAINYKKESMVDDVSVKEVDLDNIINSSKIEITTPKTVHHEVISYQEEEDFLEALKKLQQQIS